MTQGRAAQLSAIPASKRRRMAATLGLFATLFVAIGAVSMTGRDTAAAPYFAAVSMVVAVLLALIAWGLARSVSLDKSEARLDAAVEQTVRASGATMCDCGHDHDPGELQVDTGDACAHDGAGAECAHDCQTCVLAALRPRPA